MGTRIVLREENQDSDVGVRFIKPAMKTGRINPTPTLKAIFYRKKVLSFELTNIHY